MIQNLYTYSSSCPKRSWAKSQINDVTITSFWVAPRAFQVSWQAFCNLSWQARELCITVVGTAMLKYVALVKIDYKSAQSTKQGAHEVVPIWWLEVSLLRPILVTRSGPGGPIYCMMTEFVLHKICMVLNYWEYSLYSLIYLYQRPNWCRLSPPIGWVVISVAVIILQNGLEWNKRVLSHYFMEQIQISCVSFSIFPKGVWAQV